MITSLIMGLHPTIARSCGRPPRLWENKEAWFSLEVRDFCPWAWRGVRLPSVWASHNHSKSNDLERGSIRYGTPV